MATESKMDPQSYWSKWQQDHHAKYSIFQKDFIRDKLIKFTLSSFKQSSYFKYQQYMNQKDGRIDIGNQIKLWFLFRNNNQIIAKIKENLYEICYYRSGMEFGGGVYNFYGGLEHDKYLSQKIYKIGFETFKQQLKSNLRLQYKHEQSNLIFQQKIQISDKNWRYKSYLSYDIMNKLLKNCQFQIGNINIYGNSIYLRNRSKKQSNLTLKNLFSQIMVDYVHQASDKNLFGVQGVYNWDKGRIVFGSVWQHRFNEQKGRNVDCLKIKGDFDRNINITLNKSIENFGHYIYGLKICDFGRSNKLTYGISLNIHF